MVTPVCIAQIIVHLDGLSAWLMGPDGSCCDIVCVCLPSNSVCVLAGMECWHTHARDVTRLLRPGSLVHVP